MTTTRTGIRQPRQDGITLIETVQQFGTSEQAESWLVAQRWPGGVRCAYCGHDDIASWKRPNSSLRWWRCKKRQGGCGKRFSVKTNSVMQQSKLPLEKWCMAFFLAATSPRGAAGTTVQSDSGITQKPTWHLGRRILKSFEDRKEPGVSAGDNRESNREPVVDGPNSKDILFPINHNLHC